MSAASRPTNETSRHAEARARSDVDPDDCGHQQVTPGRHAFGCPSVDDAAAIRSFAAAIADSMSASAGADRPAPRD